LVKRILKSRVTSWLSLLVGIALSLFILFVMMIHTDFFAYRTSSLLSKYLFDGTPFSLSFERIGGNPFKGMNLRELKIRYQGEQYSYDVVRVEEIRIAYDIFSFFGEDPNLDELSIINPHIWIKPDSSGVSIPAVSGADGKFPRFRIDRLSIAGGQIIYQGAQKADAIRNLELKGSVTIRENEIKVGVEDGSGEDLRKRLVLKNINGDFHWMSAVRERDGYRVPDNRLIMNNVHIESDGSSFIISGVMRPDSMSYNLKVEVDPMDIEAVARAFSVETSHYGEVKGTLLLTGSQDSIGVKGILGGIFSGYALEDFNVDILYDRSRIHMNKCWGVLNGSLIDGNGLYSVEEPEVLHLSMYIKEVNLADGFIPGRDLPKTDLTGEMSLTYYYDDESVVFSMDLDRGHIMDFPFESSSISGTIVGDSVHFNNVLLSHPDHTVKSHGYIVDDEDIEFFIDLECTRGDTLFSYLGIEDYRADLSMNGILGGTMDSWNLRGSGECGNFEYGGAFIPDGTVNLAVLKEEGYRVYFDLRSDSINVERFGLNDFDISLEYWEDITNIKSLRMGKGGVDFSLRGEIRSIDGHSEMNFEEVLVTALDERWTGGGEFQVIVSDSELRFNDIQLHSKSGAFYLNCEWDRETESLSGGLSFERMEMQLLEAAGLIPFALEGKCRGTVECIGTLENPDIDVSIEIEDGRLDTLAVDEVEIDARYHSGLLLLDSLSIVSPCGDVIMGGEIRGLDPGGLYSWKREALEASTVDLKLYCGEMILDPFLMMSKQIPFSGGRYTGSIRISDAIFHPSVKLNGMIERLILPGFTMPSVDIIGEIHEGDATFEGAIRVSGSQYGEVMGSIPLIRRDVFYALDDRRPFKIEFVVPDGDISHITRLTDLVAEGGGRFTVSVRIGGYIDRPAVEGELKLEGARFRLSGMEENFYGVNSTILLSDTLISVKELEGREGREGKFNGSGTLVFEGWKPGRYNLSLNLEEFLLASVPDLNAIVSGRLSIESEELEGKSIPVIKGELDVNKAEIYYGIGHFSGTDETSSMSTPSWKAEIDIDIAHNTWVKTNDTNLELQGQVTLYHDQRGTYLRGDASLIRGWYNIYNNKFHITSGDLKFVRAAGFRPVIDIEAETRDPEGRSIYLTLEWHQDDVEPRLSLRHEDPGYSETDIWKMLGGGMVGTSSNGSESGWNAVGTAQNLAANYIEGLLNSQMEGLTIELESVGGAGTADGGLGVEETMIAVGKYLSQGLYFKYKQGLSMSSARHIEVEYRISRLFLLRSELIRYSEKALQEKSQRSSDEYNVDIKLRWEF